MNKICLHACTHLCSQLHALVRPENDIMSLLIFLSLRIKCTIVKTILEKEQTPLNNSISLNSFPLLWQNKNIYNKTEHLKHLFKKCLHI